MINTVRLESKHQKTHPTHCQDKNNIVQLYSLATRKIQMVTGTDLYKLLPIQYSQLELKLELLAFKNPQLTN